MNDIGRVHQNIDVFQRAGCYRDDVGVIALSHLPGQGSVLAQHSGERLLRITIENQLLDLLDGRRRQLAGIGEEALLDVARRNQDRPFAFIVSATSSQVAPVFDAPVARPETGQDAGLVNRVRGDGPPAPGRFVYDGFQLTIGELSIPGTVVQTEDSARQSHFDAFRSAADNQPYRPNTFVGTVAQLSLAPRMREVQHRVRGAILDVTKASSDREEGHNE
ncbi:hypothetical protein DL770_002630 [Monosporascus sp. CRB-9-2]|nr:hypothetical protein DL770_002630 [Monosporascus sp. CRB-9-2]